MVQQNFKINITLFVAVISLLINLVFNVKTIESLLMVRHPSVYYHKPVYKPTYNSPSLVSRRVNRNLYYNTPSPMTLGTGLNTSTLNNFEMKRPLPFKMDSSVSLTQKGMNFRRFMWNEMDESMDDLIKGVANGADVVKHIFVNPLPFPQPVRPTFYRYKPHFDYYKAPMDPGKRLRHLARELSSKFLGMPRKVTKIITVPPSLVPFILPSKSTIPKPITSSFSMSSTTTTTTTTIKAEKSLEQNLKKNETKILPKPELQNPSKVNPLTVEELVGTETLKELEKEGEQRVEDHVLSALNNEVVSGKIPEFDSSWTPIVNPVNANQYEIKTHEIPIEIEQPKQAETYKVHHFQSYEPLQIHEFKLFENEENKPKNIPNFENSHFEPYEAPNFEKESDSLKLTEKFRYHNHQTFEIEKPQEGSEEKIEVPKIREVFHRYNQQFTPYVQEQQSQNVDNQPKFKESFRNSKRPTYESISVQDLIEEEKPKKRNKSRKSHRQPNHPQIQLESFNLFDDYALLQTTTELPQFHELSPQKSIPVSKLHIDVDEFKPIKSYSSSDSYEVTENSAEESKQVAQSVNPKKGSHRKTSATTKPSKNKYIKTLTKPNHSSYQPRSIITSSEPPTSILNSSTSIRTSTSTTTTTTTTISPTTISSITTTTTEKQNYPDYFLDRTFSDIEKSESNCDDQTTTENPILKKLQVIIRKERLNHDKKYSNIQSVTTANPSKTKSMRKYSTKLKMTNFKDLYTKKAENDKRKQLSVTETSSRKRELIESDPTVNSNTRDQSRERKSSASMRNTSKGRSSSSTIRSPANQSHIETTTIYGNRDVNYFRKNKLRRGSRKYIEKE